MSTAPMRVEVNGHAATADQLRYPALANYGHCTVMQVRDGRARGLDLHLRRLDTATQELFGASLDAGAVRDHVRRALTDVRDASVLVSVFWPQTDDRASVMVAVRPPADPPDTPQSFKSVPYQRPIPHIKHVGSFAQLYYGRLAKRQGFDDALLTGPGGDISEGAISNVAFYDGATVIWPSAPCLVGITMQLLESTLAHAGLPTTRAPIRLSDLPSFTGAFTTNSLGIAAVSRIDSTSFPVDRSLMKTITETYKSVTWDQI